MIDEARTPLIISGSAEKPEKEYKRIGAIVEGLIEKEVEDLNEKRQLIEQRLTQMTTVYTKIVGAIEVLTQIEEGGVEETETDVEAPVAEETEVPDSDVEVPVAEEAEVPGDDVETPVEEEAVV